MSSGPELIDGLGAWKAAASSETSRWADISDRFMRPLVEVEHRAKFAFDKSDRFFCIGSCFARNIEEHLIYRGIDVLSRRVVAPREEVRARPNSLINKYTTFSMANELSWVVNPPDDYSAALLETSEGWRDLQLAPTLPGVSRERALERRRYTVESYFARLRAADVVIITLGLCEVWRDNGTGYWLNGAPTLWSVRREPGRFSVTTASVEANLQSLLEIYRNLKSLSPAVKVIVTVSPVPLGMTFSGKDVLQANTLGKSTLRAVAQGFEMVTLSDRAAAYGEDCLHVNDAVVERVVGAFFSAYGPECRVLEPGFSELSYLELNPDVEDLVRSGGIDSGFHHWMAVGKREERSFILERPSERMRTLGIS